MLDHWDWIENSWRIVKKQKEVWERIILLLLVWEGDEDEDDDDSYSNNIDSPP